MAVLTSFVYRNISRDPRLGTWGGMCPHAGAHGGYFGHAMLEIEQAHSGSVAIILAGAVGNVDMWFPNISDPWIREYTDIHYGCLLAALVELALTEGGEEMKITVRWLFDQMVEIRIGPLVLMWLPGRCTVRRVYKSRRNRKDKVS